MNQSPKEDKEKLHPLEREPRLNVMAHLELYLRSELEACLDHYYDIRKLKKVLRDEPEYVLVFINGLPEPDMTVVGIEYNDDEVLCLQCAAEEKKANSETVTVIYRDDAEQEDYICRRCGKEFQTPRSGGFHGTT